MPESVTFGWMATLAETVSGRETGGGHASVREVGSRPMDGQGLLRVLKGYVELARPLPTAGAGLLVLVAIYVAGGPAGAPSASATAVVGTVLATIGGFAVNDHFDREIDAINDPDRPIPRGAVSPRGALGYAGVTFTAAILAGVLWLPWLALAIVVANVVILIAYTPLAKGRYGLGNLVVSYLVGSAVLVGGAAVESVEPVLVMAALAGLMILAFEIFLDVEDITGDARKGLRSLPILLGRDRAMTAANVVLVMSILLSPIPYLRGTFGTAYIAVILVANGLTVVTIWAAITRSAAVALAWVKAAMMVCLMAFIAGRMF